MANIIQNDYDNLPNLLELIEKLSFQSNRKMPSNFVLKLTMTNNIFYTCAILSISTYEIIRF